MTAASTLESARLEARLAAIAADTGAALCVLFGSRAAARAGADADVDLAVLYEPLPPPEERLRLIGAFQAAAGGVDVDLVFLDGHTDPVLLFEVFRGGRLLHEGAAGLMVQRRVDAFMRYTDAQPFLRQRRARLRRELG